MSEALTPREQRLLWVPGNSHLLSKLEHDEDGDRMRYIHLKPAAKIAYISLFAVAVSIGGVVFGVLVYTSIIPIPHMIGLFIVIPSSISTLVFLCIYMCQKGREIQFDSMWPARPRIYIKDDKEGKD